MTSKELKKIHSRLVISPVTIMELYKGAKTKERKQELERQLKSYSIVHLNKDDFDLMENFRFYK